MYFPYSQIIETISGAVSRHRYFNGWQTYEEQTPRLEPALAESEIYY